jgi:hypothetical protein
MVDYTVYWPRMNKLQGVFFGSFLKKNSFLHLEDYGKTTIVNKTAGRSGSKEDLK